MSSIPCKTCGKVCVEYIWGGPDGDFCDDCVPRNECFNCNYFKKKRKARLSKFGSKISIKKRDGFYYLIDNKGRLVPCVDYFCYLI